MEIEFVEDSPERPPLATTPHVAAPGRRFDWFGLLGPILLAGSAALAAVAPFHRLYSVLITQPGFRERVMVDGWGRLQVSVSDGTPFHQHGPRFGIVVAALAAVAALLALIAIWTYVARRLHLPRVALPAIATGLAVALGVAAASAWLEAASQVDNARALTHPGPGETLADVPQVHTGYGGFLWLTLAAAGCALIGAAAFAVRPPRRADPPLPPPDPIEYAPADELGEPLAW